MPKKERRHSHISDRPLKIPKNQCLVFTQRLNIVAFIFVILSAIIILITAAVLYSELKKYQFVLPVTIPVGFIIISLFFIITSVVALIGIKYQLMKAILVAIAFLLILFIIEISIGGATYAYRNSLQDKLDQWWLGSTDEVRNSFQTNWNCCGFQNPTDHPGSNCVNGTTSQTKGFELNENLIEASIVERDLAQSQEGCMPTLINLFQSRLTTIAVVGLVFAFIQLFALLFSIVLYIVLYREKNRSYLEV